MDVEVLIDHSLAFRIDMVCCCYFLFDQRESGGELEVNVATDMDASLS